MNDCDLYVKEINNIFSILERLKNGWANSENLSHIEEINQYKRIVIQGANFLEKQRNARKKER